MECVFFVVVVFVFFKFYLILFPQLRLGARLVQKSQKACFSGIKAIKEIRKFENLRNVSQEGRS